MNLSPQKLFLVDGLGALLSAFMLGVVLVHFKSVFGMPATTLYLLAFIPCIFVLYDVVCYLKVRENKRLFLKGIAVANLSYCLLSIVMLIYHYEQLTYLGILYFIGELIIVVLLANLQLRIASNKQTT